MDKMWGSQKFLCIKRSVSFLMNKYPLPLSLSIPHCPSLSSILIICPQLRPQLHPRCFDVLWRADIHTWEIMRKLSGNHLAETVFKMAADVLIC